MKNVFLWTCYAVIWTMSVAQCSSFIAEAKVPQDKVADSHLVGSTWRMVYDNPSFGHREYDLIFREKGRLINTHPNEKTPYDDTWEVNGKKVVLKFNNGYAVYKGELFDRNHMSGTATSKAGGTWKWKASRLEKQEKK